MNDTFDLDIERIANAVVGHYSNDSEPVVLAGAVLLVAHHSMGDERSTQITVLQSASTSTVAKHGLVSMATAMLNDGFESDER